jgi:hypothetical protein
MRYGIGMKIVTATTDVTRVPDLPERQTFVMPWRINRMPTETYFTRMDETGLIWIWHPVKNTLRAI